MLDKSLSASSNLLSGAMYYPRRMICKFAKYKPEDVREMFRNLYDEGVELEKRINDFRVKSDKLLLFIRENIPEHEKAKNHYQDFRAICVYLSFRYPERYFLYKSSMYSDFSKLVALDDIAVSTDAKKDKLALFFELCQKVIDEVRKDPKLIMMHQELEKKDARFFSDTELHLLAQTIIYVFPNSQKEPDYWPSKEEYDPRLSTDDWLSILTDSSITTENNLQMFSMMLDYGKPATCTQLAEKYGKKRNYFNSGSSSYAEKVAKKTGCPVPPERINENARWWPILYVGREAEKDEKGIYVWKLRDELKAALEQIDLPEVSDETEEKALESKRQFNSNTILYGPPGTGKTYNTVLYSVAIIEEKSIDEITSEAREHYDEVKERYNAYKEAGQIAFTTFHQSYGYEEFIEGIRPVLERFTGEEGASQDSMKLEYELRSGAFKEFCERAGRPVLVEMDQDMDLGLNLNPVVWKVSLEGAGDNPTRRECFENNHIRIGWDEYGPDIDDTTEYNTGGKAILNAFINQMRIGDVVLSCFSKSEIDAIGIIVGDAEWDEQYTYYRRVRRVKWLVKGIRENILRINNGSGMTLSTVYKMKVEMSDVMDILKKYIAPETVEQKKNYVFIIDEINRGNISKIFGELITLIEESKRIGAKEEMRVRLPYSGVDFGVPSNVYIVGTMNTADRSIALMDTALRRRFSFIEMLPKPEALRDLGADKVESDGQILDVADMLSVINNRIEYLYDREHTIGHAFFMPLKDDPTIDRLAAIFEKSIIPLLQEYFFEDYRKIQMVLGDDGKKNEDKQYQFIRDIETKLSDIFATVPDIETQNIKYEIQKEALHKIESYKKIGKGL